MDDERELVGPQDRTAVAVYRIQQVDTLGLPPLTTGQIADLCSMSHSAAWRMLCNISRVTPLRRLRYGWTFRQFGVDRYE